MAFSEFRVVALAHAKVGTTQTDFVFLFAGTYPWLRTTTNGGKLTNASGFDLVFASTPAGTTTYNYEVESYNPVTGAIRAWVKVPSASGTDDTPVYALYGNSAITTFQGGSSANVWSKYSRVYHFLASSAHPGSFVSEVDSSLHFDLYAIGSSPSVAGPTNLGTALGQGGSESSFVDTGLPSGQAARTFMMWFNPIGTITKVVTSPFFKYGTNANVDKACSISLFDLDPGIVLVASPDTIDGPSMNTPALSIALGDWHHVAFVWSGTTGKIYFDGVLQVTASRSTWNTVLSGFVNIGDNGVELDEIRIAGTAFAADTILAEFNSQTDPSTFYSISEATLFPPTVDTVALTMYVGTVPSDIAGTGNVIETTGYDGSITVALIGGVLPPGTVLAANLTDGTGVITGFIPVNSGPNGDGTGVYLIHVSATDSNGVGTGYVTITVLKLTDGAGGGVPGDGGLGGGFDCSPHADVVDPQIAICACPPNATTIGAIANWAAVGKLKRYDILTDAVEAAVDVYRMLCGKVPFDILHHISQEYYFTPGQSAYSVSCLEPELAGIISVRVSYGTNKYRRLRRSHARVYDNLGSLTSSIPSTYARFGHQLEFNPMPRSASYTYRLRYWSLPTLEANVSNTVLLTPPNWDELLKWEVLYRMYLHLDMFEKAQQLVAPTSLVGNQRQRSVKHTIMFETAIIPRLWNDLLLTISQREGVDEDFGINPTVRRYTRVS